LFQIGFLEILIILLVGILVIKTFTRFQNKFFEFRSSIERDIGAEDLKQDIFNELKMEEFEKEKDDRSK